MNENFLKLLERAKCAGFDVRSTTKKAAVESFEGMPDDVLLGIRDALYELTGVPTNE